MPRYLISLRVDNALASVPSGAPVRKGGFYTAREIDADSEELARIRATDEVSRDLALTSRAKNPKEDPITISVEEVEVVADSKRERRILGYAWFCEP